MKSTIKACATRYPFALTASLLLLGAILFIFFNFAVALYRDVVGISCVGLFGTKTSCFDLFYVGVDVIYALWFTGFGRVVVLAIAILYCAELVRVLVLKR